MTTSTLRAFDDEMDAVFALMDECPNLRYHPHLLAKVSDLPWGFADFCDAIQDEDNYRDPERGASHHSSYGGADLSGDWMQHHIQRASVRNSWPGLVR